MPNPEPEPNPEPGTLEPGTGQGLDDPAEQDDARVRVTVLRAGFEQDFGVGEHRDQLRPLRRLEGLPRPVATHGHVPARSPALCDIRRWMVICDTSPNGLCICRTSGTYVTTGSSRASSPRSRSCMIAMPVNVLVIEAQ